MIDFQDGGLEQQVYELISKMCELGSSDEFPHFKTMKVHDSVWKCELTIPGVILTSRAYGKKEVDAINACASKMLQILKKYHSKDEYDASVEESIFKGNIEQFFGNAKYDENYKYRLCETDILIDSHNESNFELFKKYASDTINKLNEQGEEIEEMSEIVTIRFLVKKKK